MMQTVTFFILTIISVIALIGVLFLSAYLGIALLRKKTNPKQYCRAYIA